MCLRIQVGYINDLESTDIHGLKDRVSRVTSPSIWPLLVHHLHLWFRSNRDQLDRFPLIPWVTALPILGFGFIPEFMYLET